MNWRKLLRDGHEGHTDPDIERASAEVFGRLVAVTELLERHVTELERELRERGEDG